MRPKVIAFDFDGTVVENAYPKIGRPKFNVLEKLKKLQSEGAKLILWTVRTGEDLEAAISFLETVGVIPDAVNDNLAENKLRGLFSRKVLADIYLDDRAINVENF